MVFKMFSTGSHTRKMNEKLIKHDEYELHVNPNNKGLVSLFTKQKDGNAYNNYQHNYHNREDFMKNFLANERSLFKMNKNIGQQTKKRNHTPKPKQQKPKQQKPKQQKPKQQKSKLFYKTRFKQLQQKQQKQQKKQKQQTEKIKRQIKHLQRSLS
jgi:hypothetical protein